MTDAVVRPQALQGPRPPLLVGALGTKTIAVGVRCADVWNAWAGVHRNEAEAIEAVRAQCALVDTACEREGRDPSILQRSLCLYPPFDPWSSRTALERLVSIFLPLGITEYVAYAPAVESEDVMTQALTFLSA